MLAHFLTDGHARCNAHDITAPSGSVRGGRAEGRRRPGAQRRTLAASPHATVWESLQQALEPLLAPPAKEAPPQRPSSAVEEENGAAEKEEGPATKPHAQEAAAAVSSPEVTAEASHTPSRKDEEEEEEEEEAAKGAAISAVAAADSRPSAEPPEKMSFVASLVESIDEVAPEEWDACATGSGDTNPFLLWAFLHALEASQSAVAKTGWLPRHVLLREASSSSSSDSASNGASGSSSSKGRLVGCCPLYLKSHSYGEYVFDHSWAHLFAAQGRSYYPKLQESVDILLPLPPQCAVPFTPATGPRLLVRGGADRALVRRALAKVLVKVTDELKVSGLHMTFNEEAEAEELAQLGFLQRTGIQYHWQNNGYKTFDDFLMDLRQSKRKSIRQERKRVAGSGFHLQRMTGAELKAHHWDAFYGFYRNTTDHKWGQAYLSREFFHRLGESLGERVLLATAQERGGGGLVAGALNLRGDTALFGRNWGCAHHVDVPFLHFELCYYQAIEAAIELGLQRVEAGAQGDHKIQRGYLPTKTFSSHYITEPAIRHSLARYLDRERDSVDYTALALTHQESPYKAHRDPLTTVSMMSLSDV